MQTGGREWKAWDVGLPHRLHVARWHIVMTQEKPASR
jgi:hypothetical protein